ncbi:uncharacterized protein LOC127285905 [Leptopilina boulardi]|uniref:uncharacterized protein LOC127285905 n=1 Tax=Leptopilina boulardi TaxID=63433 RepID=UPI0021F58700|nr:uncharacterized protein LOC127285905 [Leptopilina boulardi]
MFILEFFFSLIFIVSPLFAEDKCDKTKCPGPLRFYNEIKCKPIYKTPDECCAVKYDCSHIEERFKSKKCYVNDNVYEIGEMLKEEDSLRCSFGCICLESFRGLMEFTCPIVDCFNLPPKPGCYREISPDKCCPGAEICPRNPVTCLVDGKTLKEGDSFQPKNKTDFICFCKPGYKGENVKPFCYDLEEKSCGIELHNNYELKEKCAPIYRYQEHPQISCNSFFRCPDANDKLISRSTEVENPSNDKSDTCVFGKIVMKIGDELNPKTDEMRRCIKCKCEVPPTPTCQEISNKPCDVS